MSFNTDDDWMEIGDSGLIAMEDGNYYDTRNSTLIDWEGNILKEDYDPYEDDEEYPR